MQNSKGKLKVHLHQRKKTKRRKYTYIHIKFWEATQKTSEYPLKSPNGRQREMKK